jgi:hypothetical protein
MRVVHTFGGIRESLTQYSAQTLFIHGSDSGLE